MYLYCVTFLIILVKKNVHRINKEIYDKSLKKISPVIEYWS